MRAMTLFTSILVFLLVLVFYIHLMAQYRKSQDMEIYETDFAGVAALQEVCDVRQPVVVELLGAAGAFFEDMTLAKVLRAGAGVPVVVRDGADYRASADAEGVPVPLEAALRMLGEDSAAGLFTDGNHDFVEDADLAADVGELDALLRPQMTVQTRYDVMLGARGAHTPLRWSADLRRFLVVCAGAVSVKMTPFKSAAHLHEVRDYATLEFRSEVDVWDPQERFAGDAARVKFLEFDLAAGSALYVPPYWWYSVRYAGGEDSLLLGYAYNTLLNRVANAGDLVRCALQRHNTDVRASRLARADDADSDSDSEPASPRGGGADAPL